jgi:hypothetical protein
VAGPEADSAPWVEERIIEERRLFARTALVWLGAVPAVLAGAFLAWAGYWKAWPGAFLDGGLAAVGAALAGIGTLLERRLRGAALTLKGAGFAFLSLAAVLAVSFHGTLPPWVGLLFVILVAVAAVRLLGARAGLLALTVGTVAGVVVLGALKWGVYRDDAYDVYVLGTLAVVVSLCWRRDRTLPVGLFFAGFLLGDGMAEAWWGPASGALCITVLAVGLLLLGRLEPLFQGFSWTGAGMAMALILSWPFPGPLEWTPAARLGLGLLLSVGIAVAARGALRPARWTALATVTGLALFYILADKGSRVVLGWSSLAIVGGLIAFWGTRGLLRRVRDEADRSAAMPLAAATAAFAVLAVALALDRAWPGVAAASLVPFLVDLRARFKAPILGSIACLLAAFSGLWMFFVWPKELGASSGLETLLWIVYGFGVLLAATAVAAWIAARTPGATGLAGPMGWLAFAAAGLLSAVLTRHLFPEVDKAWLVLAALALLVIFPAVRGGVRWAVRPRAALLLIGLSMLAAPLSSTTFFATWPVKAPGARPGDVVRLELAPEVLARLQGNYGDLHLRADGREIQYEIESRKAREWKMEIQGAQPSRSAEPGISQIEIFLPARGRAFSAIRLQTRAALFYRTVVLTNGSGEIATAKWACVPSSPHPCTLSWTLRLPYLLSRATRLSLRFSDGNNPPIAPVDVEIRWRVVSISFRWPERGPVEIVTRTSGTSADRWEDTLSAPLRKAQLESRDVGPGIARAGFGAAAVILLALLAWSGSKKRPSGSFVPVLLAIAGLSTTSVPASGTQGRLYSRPVEVPTAGKWVRVPLDSTTLGHLGANGQGLRIVGPDGSRVQCSLASWDRGGDYGFFAQFGETRQEGQALSTVVTLQDPTKPLHDRLLLNIARGPILDVSPVLGARIETSPDGKVWTVIGKRDLFRVPENEHLSQYMGLLAYPATRDSYLRVTLPNAEGAYFQSAQSPRVFVAPSSILAFPLTRLPCRSGERITTCHLSLPARGLQPVGFSLDLADAGAVGVRLYTAEEGSWKLLAEGIIPDGVSRTIPLLGDPLKGRSLRVEIQGSDKAPRLAGASLDLFRPAVVFRAEKPGRYLLRYGDGGSALVEGRGSPPPEETLEIIPGPETAAPLPALASTVTSPAVFSRGFSADWPVQASGARPGDVVRLEIPEEVYACSGSHGEGLRLETEGRQIPYVRLIEDEPARAVSLPGLQPIEPPMRMKEIRVPISTRLPLTGIELTSVSRDPFQGWSSTRIWGCSPRPLLPCRLSSELTQKDFPWAWWAPQQIRFQTPAPADAVLWRRRDTLVFLWPGKGPVRLLAGSGAGAPAYDLELLASEILARPWHPAVLDSREPEIGLSGLAGLAAGCGLLILLWRSLPGGPVARPRPKRG